jgi:hypothetical protein
MVKVDVSDAEQLLQEAKKQLANRKTLKALKLTKRARETLHRKMMLHQHLTSSIAKVQLAITEARKKGIDTSDAERLLESANSAMSAGRYNEVSTLAQECIDNLKAAGILPGRDLTLRTTIDFKHGYTIYEIRVENNTQFHIRKLKVSPELPEIPVDKSVEQSTALKPSKDAKLVFEVSTPIEKENPETLLPGKDISIQTVLQPIRAENRIVYSVWVKNMRSTPITGIRVVPNLPPQLVPDANVKIIDVLNPQETKAVVFEVYFKPASSASA